MSYLGRRRVALMGLKGRKQFASSGGKALWATMSPAERSFELKRRARVRRRNKAKAARAKLDQP